VPREDTGGDRAGAAYIFTRSGTTWTQQAKIQASDKEQRDEFGYSVSISSDGNTAIVGAYLEDTGATDAGAAYIFTRSGGTWTQQAKIQASDKETNDWFGWSVSISGDGNTAIVGATGEGTGDTGAAYIFTRSGGTWTQQAKIQASDKQAYDNFGWSVSISSDGNTALVGSPGEGTGGVLAGAAYIFTRSGTTWTQQQKIQASDKEQVDRFGYSVFISSDGNTAIVGAHGEDTGATSAGAAYIFTRSGTTWTQQAKIQASDKEANDQFGYSVSISGGGNIAVVGAYLEDTGGDRAGAAYIFTRSGTTWTQQQKIQASNLEGGDEFGWSVSISSDGNTAIVGARSEDTGASGAGAAYIFIQSGYYI
jgi:N-acetylglucosamine kinase-like BadF-type ATPase